MCKVGLMHADREDPEFSLSSWLLLCSLGGLYGTILFFVKLLRSDL